MEKESFDDFSRNARGKMAVEMLRATDENFSRYITVLNVKKCLSNDQEKDLTETAFGMNLKYNLIVHFALYAGLRPEEIASLRKSDIDIPNKKIFIREHVEGKELAWKPKTKANERIININFETVKEIKSSLDNIKKDDDKVIHSQKSKGKNGAYNTISIINAVNRASIKTKSIGEKIGTNTLRRTCAFKMIENGSSLDIVARQLGYESMRTLLEFLFDCKINEGSKVFHRKL